MLVPFCLNYRKSVLRIKAIGVLLRHDFVILFHETANSIKTSPIQHILLQGCHAWQGARLFITREAGCEISAF